MAEKLVIVGPPIADLPADLQAPLDEEGSFAFEPVAKIEVGDGFYIPYNQQGRPLSPMELGTDVALPIVARHRGTPNRHHAYFYERHYLKAALGIQAVRNSRRQRVNPQAHAYYHRRYFGTAISRDESLHAKAIILNSAGYVAPLGVKVSKNGTSIVELTQTERDRLRKPGVFTIERPSREQGKIARFLMEYALRQPMNHVDQSQIEEFLTLTPRKMAYDEGLRARKLRLGLRLTNIALDVAVEPIEPEYQEARRQRALRQGTPSRAWKWAKSLLKGRERNYLLSLEDRLIDEFGSPI